MTTLTVLKTIGIRLYAILFFIFPFFGICQEKDNTEYKKFRDQVGVVLIEGSEAKDTLLLNKDLTLVTEKKYIYGLSNPSDTLFFFELTLFQKRYHIYGTPYTITYNITLDLDEVEELFLLQEFLKKRKEESFKFSSRYYKRMRISLDYFTRSFYLFFYTPNPSNGIPSQCQLDSDQFDLLLNMIKEIL